MTSHDGLKVIIVGSGLAGLTAARVLREHHQVTVYERGDVSVATGGQGVIIAPNGTKILEKIGYDRDRAGSVPIYGVRTYNKEGEPQEEIDMDLKPRFGADCLAQKRSDFRDELLRLATAPSAELGISGEPAYILFKKNVIGLDTEQGIITLSDGTTVGADVVVVADGVHSRLRNIILDSDSFVAKKTGLTCYRVAISTEDAKKALGDAPLPHWWDIKTGANRSSIIHAADGTPRMITAYPIRGHTAFNLSCILRTQDSSKETTESWHADGDRNKMVELFSDFSESIRKILGVAKEVKVWELQDLATLPTWTRGRAILIGDSAHAMSPLQGQGLNLAVEDAEGLSLLERGTKRDEVMHILKLVDSIRRPRTAHILAETQATHKNMKVAERLNKNLDYNCSYNGIREALKAGQ